MIRKLKKYFKIHIHEGQGGQFKPIYWQLICWASLILRIFGDQKYFFLNQLKCTIWSMSCSMFPWTPSKWNWYLILSFYHRILWNLENILNTFIDLISLIFMEIWPTLAKLLPKKTVLLPKITCSKFLKWDLEQIWNWYGSSLSQILGKSSFSVWR